MFVGWFNSKSSPSLFPVPILNHIEEFAIIIFKILSEVSRATSYDIMGFQDPLSDIQNEKGRRL